VRRIKSFLALLLALGWLPATSHCLLETLGAIPEFLHCADACGPGDTDRSEDADACASVETATYKTEEQPLLVAGVFVTIVPLLPDAAEPLPASQKVFARGPADVPELPVTWQFTQRASLPPRAPSSAS